MRAGARRGLKIVAIGASADGLGAICRLIERFPGDLPAAVIVVLHRPADQPSSLPEVLARHTRLRLVSARDGMLPERGTCYVGPPDRRITYGVDGRLHLANVPADGRHAIDALFASMASSAGANAIGVVLSGMLDDGARGLAAIKAAGGTALVQDPAEARFRSMPENAIRLTGAIDFIGTAQEIGEELRRRLAAPATAEEEG